jgi:hypothetical protein
VANGKNQIRHHAERAEVYFDEKGCICQRDMGADDAKPASIPIEDLNAENDE